MRVAPGLPRDCPTWALFPAVIAGQCCIPGLAAGQELRDGETLPKGVGIVVIAPGLGGGTDRFGPSFGFFERESALADYDHLRLAEVMAGDAAGAAQIEGLLGGLGQTNFVASQTAMTVRFTVGYGITDRWTVAVVAPFTYASYSLEAWLTQTTDPVTGEAVEPSHFRVKDPRGIQCPKGDLDISDPAALFDRVLVDGGSDYRFNVGDLRQALVSECLGYKDPVDRLEVGADGLVRGKGARTYSGFRDLILATKYKFWHTERLRLSGLFYVVAPTGRVDDPDDLFDPAFGDGQWDMALIAGATSLLGPFRLSLSGGYEVQLPDTQTRRLFGLRFTDALEGQLARGELSEAELYDRALDQGFRTPLVTAYEKANVRRNLGDNIYLYALASYELSELLTVTFSLDYSHTFRDSVSDTGTRIADGSRLLTSDEIRAQVDAEIAAGTLSEAERVNVLAVRLSESAERKAAAFAWHSQRDLLVAGLAFELSTIKPFLRDEFPIPVIVSLSGALPVAGRNIDVQNSFSLAIQVPFAFGEVKDPAEYGSDDEPGQGLPWP